MKETLKEKKMMDMEKLEALQNLKAEFWDGKYKVESEDGKIDFKPFFFNEEGIPIAIKRALGDFTDRTERLNPKSGYKSFGVEEKFEVLCGTDGEKHEEPEKGSFVQEFIDYFFHNDGKNMGKEEFDEWHHNRCKQFLEVIGPKYRGELKYGKAQKVVNMTFKNAYCLPECENSGLNNSGEFYTHCHMPLDSFTLEWIGRAQKWVGQQKDAIKSKNGVYLRKSRIPSWSSMNYEEDSKKYYGYKEIQDVIFTYFEENILKNPSTKYLKGYTPLQAEFFVWKYMKFELAAEQFYNQCLSFIEVDDKTKNEQNEFKGKTINKKLECLQEKLKDIEISKVPEEV